MQMYDPVPSVLKKTARYMISTKRSNTANEPYIPFSLHFNNVVQHKNQLSLEHYEFGDHIMACRPLVGTLISFALGFSAFVTADTEPLDQPKANSIFFGGDILTMVGEQPKYAEALVVRGEEIAFVGDKESSLRYADENTELIDLQGQTLLPGFIDPHSHVYGVGLQAMVANLLPPPDGQAKTVDDLMRLLSEAQ